MSKHASVDPPRPRRTKTLVVGALALALVTALVAFLLWPEKNTQPAQKADEFAEVLAPDEKDAVLVEALVTPPGEDWWGLVQSVAHDLRLSRFNHPSKANWYSVTASEVKDKSANRVPTQVLHVAFSTRADLDNYLATFKDKDWHTRRYLIRGTVVTISGTMLNLENEPFPDVSTKTSTLVNDTVTQASWRYNIGDALLLETRSNHIANFQQNANSFFEHTGYGEDTTWAVTATKPDGPWTGVIEHFNFDKIDLDAALRVRVDSETWECAGMSCDALGTSVESLMVSNVFRVAKGAEGIKPAMDLPYLGVDNSNWLIEDVDDGTVFEFAHNLVDSKAQRTGTTFIYDVPRPIVAGQISNRDGTSGKVTLMSPKRKAQRDSEIEEIPTYADGYAPEKPKK